MRECVLDASVVLMWFGDGTVQEARGARRLRAEFESGELDVLAPPLIHLEILNVAGRRWGWAAEPLQELAEVLDDLSLELVAPELTKVARWVAAGLTAYDAAYVAVAEVAAVPLITTDQMILGFAPAVARPIQ